MDIERRQMRNGLVVVSEEMPQLRSVSMGVWVKGGSRAEGEEDTGISHFIEHLLFKGTRNRSASNIAQAIDSVGGHLDAFTDKEYVGFYAKVLDTHLSLAFDLLSDIVLNPTFPTAEIERERSVIFEEINMMEDSPQELIHDMFMETFWDGHPLGRRISGTKKSVGGIGRKDVLRYFKNNYTACNTVLSVAGNTTHRVVNRLATRYFSDLRSGAKVDSGPPPVAHAGRSILRKPNLEQTHLCVGTECPPLVSEDRFSAHVLSSILGGGMSSRLFQNVRERRGLVYSIYTNLNMFRDAGSLTAYAATSPERVAEVLELTLKEFKKVRDKAVPHEELKRAKENIKGSLMLSLESSSSRMTHLAQQEIYYGGFMELEKILARVERVNARDILRLADRIFNVSAFTLTVLDSRNGMGVDSLAV